MRHVHRLALLPCALILALLAPAPASAQTAVIPWAWSTAPNHYPLVDLTAHFTGQSPEPRERVPVIVFSEHGRSVGLVVHKILDIVTEAITIEHTSQRPGLIGTAVIQHRVTDLMDVRAVVETTTARFGEPAIAA